MLCIQKKKLKTKKIIKDKEQPTKSKSFRKKSLRFVVSSLSNIKSLLMLLGTKLNQLLVKM